MEQPDDHCNWHPEAFESRKNTLPELCCPPHFLELLAVVHALLAFQPHLLDKQFDLHTDNTSLQWLQEQHTISHHQARWLDAIAEFKFKVVHIPGSMNPADFIPRKRFASGPCPAPTAGYTGEGREGNTELFFVGGKPAAAFLKVRLDPSVPLFIHQDFTAALGGGTLADESLGSVAWAAQAVEGAQVSLAGQPLSPEAASAAWACFVWRLGLLYRRTASGDRLYIPEGQVLRRRCITAQHRFYSLPLPPIQDFRPIQDFQRKD